MATGVSLKGATAALVLLHHGAGRYTPTALAIKGNYDRLGSIDGIKEDANTRLVLRFFSEGLRSGTFRVDEESLAADGCFPIRTVEQLLHGFERNMNDGSGYAVLHGHPVVFAVVALAVWDTIARAAPPPVEPLSAQFQRLFGPCSVATEIYAGSLGEAVRAHRRAGRDRFVPEQPMGAARLADGGRGEGLTPRRCDSTLDEARRTFADSAAIMAAACTATPTRSGSCSGTSEAERRWMGVGVIRQPC